MPAIDRDSNVAIPVNMPDIQRLRVLRAHKAFMAEYQIGSVEGEIGLSMVGVLGWEEALKLVKMDVFEVGKAGSGTANPKHNRHALRYILSQAADDVVSKSLEDLFQEIAERIHVEYERENGGAVIKYMREQMGELKWFVPVTYREIAKTKTVIACRTALTKGDLENVEGAEGTVPGEGKQSQ